MRTIQRIILVTVLLFAGVFKSKAQTYVLIPDANFRTYLQGLIPSAMNGNSLNITSTLVTTGTQTIYVRSLNISDLTGIQYFSSLNYLDCGLNQLIGFPTLPNSIHSLYCFNNTLSNLPVLPASLKVLHCENNSLTSIPLLPDSLQALVCSSNSLTNLPPLPNSIKIIYCDHNSLISLPTLPDSLQFLFCNNNNLNSLPILSNSLQGLYCDHNNISCFPTFPNSILPAQYNGNTHQWGYSLVVDNNPFNCMPNYVSAMSPSLLATPLCVSGNTNGCPIANGIEEFNLNNYQVSVYPNPNSGSFKIKIGNEMEN